MPIFIEPSFGRTTTPTVTLRRPTSSGQRCVAINAALAVRAELGDSSRVSIQFDDTKSELLFIPTTSEVFQGHRTHRMVADGGGNSVGRAVFVRASALSEKQFPSGRYAATIGHAGRFSISVAQPKKKGTGG